SRPQPWQGCALPTELFPQLPSLNRIASAKVEKISVPANFFRIFFEKKIHTAGRNPLGLYGKTAIVH
ncbi:hypothetical protein, partial [uncultured Alistipes sp.]|uniref:hypothetical protein n=1 Tax=uncultured Alistipes sp. TaxID=538949 RepID=UPI0026DF6E92